MLLMILMDIIPDKYPLSVQNIKFGSKLYINADITEIHQFRQRFVIKFTFLQCWHVAAFMFFSIFAFFIRFNGQILIFYIVVHSVCLSHFIVVG